MIKCLYSLLFLLSISFSYAQLPVDEKGKVNFNEVVDAGAFSKKTLYANAALWATLKISDRFVVLSKDSVSGKITAQDEFMLYSQTGVLKKISGQVTYSILVQVRDSLYRYNFTDFVFHYYKQDRYYKMVPTGKTKPFEDPKAGGWQKLWTKHRKAVAIKIQKDIEELKAQMVYVTPEPSKEPEKKKEVKWD